MQRIAWTLHRKRQVLAHLPRPAKGWNRSNFGPKGFGMVAPPSDIR
jgi:hypothetical protein